ncbi:MAG: 3'3'-cGAMP-specific phosphodiesterase 2 [Candidatus Dichloromethanomonas elyunquensis]|nr:MAG: 3'3'-cGAMP-specific phosphodiesterase 2 [Candidatus Dichloromethanomonas elyunquensis]
MLYKDKNKQEKYILTSQVISFCLLAIVILVAISFKDQLFCQMGYYHSTVMFAVMLPLIIMVRLLSVQYSNILLEYAVNIFYFLLSAVFLVLLSQSAFEILLIMPVIIMALKYGTKHAVYTASCSIAVLFFVGYRKAFASIDSDLMYFIVFLLVAWLIGNMRDSEKEIQRKLERLASHDGLTGLRNHRSFQLILDEMLDRAEKRKEPLSLIMLDIDYFKVYNDSFGHQKGDSVLKLVAAIIRECTPEWGECARYGGEEFIVILPGKTMEFAKAIGEQIGSKIENAKVPGAEVLPKGRLTVSVGVAEYPLIAANKEKLIQKADEALYKAKFASKDKVEIYYSVFDELSLSLMEGERDLLNSIRTLTMVIDAKDRYTYGHSERAMQLARKLAEKVRLNEEETKELCYSSLLHDIGKIEISREILNKPAELNAPEWEILKQHPQWGADIIRPMQSLKGTVEIILHHHENYDGSGYPKGFKGEDIPLGARILRIIDSYDAMTSDRPYKRGMTEAQAIEELSRLSGQHYDPFLLEKFIQILSE